MLDFISSVTRVSWVDTQEYTRSWVKITITYKTVFILVAALLEVVKENKEREATSITRSLTFTTESNSSNSAQCAGT